MRVTELHDELAGQAAEMDTRYVRLPDVYRRGRQVRRRRRITAVAGTVTVVAGLLAVTAPIRQQVDDPAPPAAGAVHSTAQVGETIQLSEGVSLVVHGPAEPHGRYADFTLTTPRPDGSGTDVIRLTADLGAKDDEHLYTGALPGGEGQLLTLIPPAHRVDSTIEIPGQRPAGYDADVYRLPATPAWTLVYLRFPLNGFQLTPDNAHRIVMEYASYDANGDRVGGMSR